MKNSSRAQSAELRMIGAHIRWRWMASRNPGARKRGTNVSLRSDLVAEARELGVALSSACEEGLAAAVKQEKERRWLEENRAALDSWNRYIAENGLPLAKYRSF